MKTASRSQIRFAVCIKNKGYEASLELGKLYPVIPDKDAAEHGYLRIVDESGEDYGYAANRFFAIAVPKPLQKVLLRRRRDNRSPNRALQRGVRQHTFARHDRSRFHAPGSQDEGKPRRL